MKLRINIETTETGYSLEADLDFDEKRKNEYVGVGYSYAVIGVILTKFQDKLLKQSNNVNRNSEIDVGMKKAASEANKNKMWPFDKTIIKE